MNDPKDQYEDRNDFENSEWDDEADYYDQLEDDDWFEDDWFDLAEDYG